MPAWGYLFDATLFIGEFFWHLAREFVLLWFLNLLILVSQARLLCLQLFTTLCKAFKFYLEQTSERVSMESLYQHILTSLDCSQSRRPLNFPGSISLRPFQSQSLSCHWDSDIFSLCLGLDDPNLVPLIPELENSHICVYPPMTAAE